MKIFFNSTLPFGAIFPDIYIYYTSLSFRLSNGILQTCLTQRLLDTKCHNTVWTGFRPNTIVEVYGKPWRGQELDETRLKMFVKKR